MQQFFTSLDLYLKLLEEKAPIYGTVRKNRTELAPDLQ